MNPPKKKGYVHACTPADIVKVFELVEQEHLEEIELIVFRQPKRKEEILEPVWGRFIYYADIGKYSGPAVYLEATFIGKVIKWGDKLARGKQGKQHPLLSVVMIAILATIGGSQGWEDIELYAKANQQWLETFLDLPHGIPHADCYRRVFARIDSDGLQRCFSQWISEIVEQTAGQVIPIDGKTLRGSYD